MIDELAGRRLYPCQGCKACATPKAASPHLIKMEKIVTKGKMKIEIKRPGAMRKKTGTPKGEKIPVEKLEKEKKSSNPLTRKQANFALNAKKWDKGGKKK